MKLVIIQQKIFEIRGQNIMLDFDLAELYGVKTYRLNEQIKRNLERFPKDFMFRLTKKEWEFISSQIARSSKKLLYSATHRKMRAVPANIEVKHICHMHLQSMVLLWRRMC